MTHIIYNYEPDYICGKTRVHDSGDSGIGMEDIRQDDSWSYRIDCEGCKKKWVEYYKPRLNEDREYRLVNVLKELINKIHKNCHGAYGLDSSNYDHDNSPFDEAMYESDILAVVRAFEYIEPNIVKVVEEVEVPIIINDQSLFEVPTEVTND